MLSDLARSRLDRLLDDSVFYWKGQYRKDEVLRLIEEIVATPSFSEQIIETSQVKRRCSLGQWHVVYRIHFRVVLIPALRLLVQEGRPMTTGELAERLPTHVGRMMHYLGELRHWGLVTQPKTGVFEATEAASVFLAGELPIASFVWPKGESLPPECQDGELRYIDELEDAHPKDDKARHVEESVHSVTCPNRG